MYIHKSQRLKGLIGQGACFLYLPALEGELSRSGAVSATNIDTVSFTYKHM